VPRLKEGDVLPDGEMWLKMAKTLRFTDFRGKALAFTFFSRLILCPITARAWPAISSRLAEAL